ncbi:hypothetical protein B566_EDAN008032 [Ephemera danica]|nr:hypothetical protein B566_EDAN008032 [Ephemera danica]
MIGVAAEVELWLPGGVGAGMRSRSSVSTGSVAQFFALTEHIHSGHCVVARHATDSVVPGIQPNGSSRGCRASSTSETFRGVPRTVGSTFQREGPPQEPYVCPRRVEVKESAFNRYLVTYLLTNIDNVATTENFFEAMRVKLLDILSYELKVKNCLKVNLVLLCNFYKVPDEYDKRNFKTAMSPVYYATHPDSFLDESYRKLNQEIEDHEGKGSGWTLDDIISIELRVNRSEVFQVGRLGILREQRSPKHQEPRTTPDQFESDNDITINIFALDENEKVYPLKVVAYEKPDHRDLLIIQDEETTHYTYIKNFNVLVSSQVTKRNGTVYVCKRCINHFNQERLLFKHREFCNANKTARIRMPEPKETGDGYEEPTVEFNRVQNQHKLPFVLYADFESFLIPLPGADNDPSISSSRSYQLHDAMSVEVYLVSTIQDVDDVPVGAYQYRGKDAPLKFMEYLRDVSSKISKLYDRQIPIQMDEEDLYDFLDATHCYLCEKEFKSMKEKRQDHCHLTGKYRGAAHNKCNLNFQEKKILPVYFHNFSGYDSHFLVRELAFDVEDGSVNIIPSTEERFITFSKMFGDVKVQFLDTFRFLPYSLDALVKFMHPSDFVHIGKQYTGEKLEMATRKGVFCYDYVTSAEKLNVKHLPTIEEFYSEINKCGISEEDYSHARRVWLVFGCENLGQFSDIYLDIDVRLLADVFEKFRKLCLHDYHLDPAWYFTVPGLAWDAALRHTGVKLDLLQDIDMLLMFEKGVRGGITQVVTRHCVAEPGKVIRYFDSNNLYGKAMSMALPTGDFQWVEPEDVPDIMSIKDDGPVGYLLEVDVHYTGKLHDMHNALPFLCERLVPPDCKEPRLMTTLHDKKNYVVHFVSLKQAVKHGLVVTRIHRAISFSQSPWFKPYIDFNTELRKQGNTKFDLEFRKLMNNSPFGKSMENVRNRLNMEIVIDPQRIEKVVRQVDFLDRTIYKENVVAVHRAKQEIYMNKPIFVGQAILDLSKTIIVELLYMDTDSFLLSIQTENIVKDMLPVLDFYDTSNLDKDNPLFSMKNAKVLSKFKSEVGEEEIQEYVGLRPKSYALRLVQGKVVIKNKGIKKLALKTKVSFELYLECVRNGLVTLVSFNRIHSHHHVVTSVHQRKVALSSNDKKRHILPDKIHTLSFGHRILHI